MSLDNDTARDQADFLHHCYRDRSVTVNPIIDWEDSDVWTFLHHYGCEGNPLYKCGENRIGCIGCPIVGTRQMQKDFAKYPKYKLNFIKAFEKMLRARKEAGLANKINWGNGADVFRWWIGDTADPNQLSFFDDEEVIEILEEMDGR